MSNRTATPGGRRTGASRRRPRTPEIFNLPADRPASQGELIRHFRTVKKWWQEDLAEALDVTAQTISRYENGRDLSTEKLRRIAAALGRPLTDFLPDVDPVDPVDPEEAELVEIFRAMDPRNRAALLHMARTLASPDKPHRSA